jgi:hypothetical protein
MGRLAVEHRGPSLARTWGGFCSWPEIIADLDSLTETEITYDGKRFIVRPPPRPAVTAGGCPKS